MFNAGRREFVGHLGKGAAAIALGGTLELGGCAALPKNVFTDILNWIPVAEDAVQGIIAVLESAGLINPAAAAIEVTINAAFKQLEADVKAYQAITPPPVGALAEIEAALGILVTNFQAFLAAIQVPNSPLLTAVVELVQIIMETIAGFENKLPATVKTAIASRTFRIGFHVYSFAPKHRTIRAFKKDWNRAAAAGGHSEIEIPLSFWEKVF
jgi:hypothetical protein